MALVYRQLIVKYGADITEALSGVQKVNSAIDKSTKEVDEKFGALTSRMKDAGSKMTMAITLPMAGIGYAAIQADKRMDSLTRGLTAVMKSSGMAAMEIQQLREVAKMPGLGFEEVIRGSTNLQAAGLSAKEARDALLEFGNALATVGRGKADLEGVQIALAQILSKGKVQGDEIIQLMERVPQIGQIMQSAFHTADTRQLAKMGVDAKTFINIVTAELSKLPRVTGGVGNAFENLGDQTDRALASLGQTMRPLVIDLAGDVESLAKWVEGLTDTQRRWIVGLGAGAAAIGPVLTGLGNLSDIYVAIRARQLLKIAAAVKDTEVTATETAAHLANAKAMDANAAAAGRLAGSITALVPVEQAEAAAASRGAAVKSGGLLARMGTIAAGPAGLVAAGIVGSEALDFTLGHLTGQTATDDKGYTKRLGNGGWMPNFSPVRAGTEGYNAAKELYGAWNKQRNFNRPKSEAEKQRSETNFEMRMQSYMPGYRSGAGTAIEQKRTMDAAAAQTRIAAATEQNFERQINEWRMLGARAEQLGDEAKAEWAKINESYVSALAENSNKAESDPSFDKVAADILAGEQYKADKAKMFRERHKEAIKKRIEGEESQHQELMAGLQSEASTLRAQGKEYQAAIKETELAYQEAFANINEINPETGALKHSQAVRDKLVTAANANYQAGLKEAAKAYWSKQLDTWRDFSQAWTEGAKITAKLKGDVAAQIAAEVNGTYTAGMFDAAAAQIEGKPPALVNQLMSNADNQSKLIAQEKQKEIDEAIKGQSNAESMAAYSKQSTQLKSSAAGIESALSTEVNPVTRIRMVTDMADKTAASESADLMASAIDKRRQLNDEVQRTYELTGKVVDITERVGAIQAEIDAKSSEIQRKKNSTIDAEVNRQAEMVYQQMYAQQQEDERQRRGNEAETARRKGMTQWTTMDQLQKDAIAGGFNAMYGPSPADLARPLNPGTDQAQQNPGDIAGALRSLAERQNANERYLQDISNTLRLMYSPGYSRR